VGGFPAARRRRDGPASVNSYPAPTTPSSITRGRNGGGGLTRALVAAAVLAPAEGAVAELALVLLLGLAGLACSSGGGRGVGGHGSRHRGVLAGGGRVRAGSQSPRRRDGSTAGRAWALKRRDGGGEAAVSLAHAAKGACERRYSTGRGRSRGSRERRRHQGAARVMDEACRRWEWTVDSCAMVESRRVKATQRGDPTREATAFSGLCMRAPLKLAPRPATP
jgi:hypothetical protein